MGMFSLVRPYVRVLSAARRHRVDLLRWLVRRPQLLGAVTVYEMALLTSVRLDARLKALAELKAGALINCEYCLDIGSAFAQAAGVTEAQVRALPTFETSDQFSESEKLVLELSEAMTRAPATVADGLRERLLRRFSRAQLTELAAAIAWENHRGRLNQALGVRPSGFSDGAVCAIPER
ncbi:MAG: carboxymuconolactone decarboxylase family protein [Pseudonocardiaceae bacterium]